MIDQVNWLYIIPLGAAIILVSLFVAGRRSLAVFYLATGVLAFAAVVWVYWITPTVPLDFYLATSAYRVVGVLAAIALAALLQLMAPGEMNDQPPPPVEAQTSSR